MNGLIISDPSRDEARRSLLTSLLHDYDLPLSRFTAEPALRFQPSMSRAAFLRAASIALLIPGEALPMDALLIHLPGDPLPANVLRRHLFLRRSLAPYLRPGRRVTQLPGCFLLGDNLLAAPVSPEDTVDAQLPPGIWTELNGATHAGCLRCMRGYNETPILVRPNTLLPVSMNGQSLTQTAAEDTDRLTLHWFQPEAKAECLLADGTFFRAVKNGEDICVDTNSTRVFHVILHQNGVEALVQ